MRLTCSEKTAEYLLEFLEDATQETLPRSGEVDISEALESMFGEHPEDVIGRVCVRCGAPMDAQYLEDEKIILGSCRNVFCHNMIACGTSPPDSLSHVREQLR